MSNPFDQPGQTPPSFPSYGSPTPNNPYETPQGPSGGPPGNGNPGKDSMAITSLVLGCICLLAWCIPCIGLPLAIAGVVTGISGLQSTQRTLAMVGMGLSIFGILASIVNGVLGVIIQLGNM